MKRIFTLILGLVAMVGTVSGQILTFEFSALAGNEATANSNSNNANLGSSTISRGAGITAGTNGGRFNATGFTTAASLDATDYFEFTITPNSGYQFSITSIAIQFQRSSTGPTKFALRSSIDSYAADLGGEQLGTDVATTQTFTFTFAQTDITTATTYRLFVYGSESVTGTGGPGDGTGNDITVNGSVSEIPSSGPANPVSFTATSASSSQVNLAFTQNAATDDVVIAFNTSNTFGEPTGTYTASDPITGGGTVLYVGAASPFNHTGLTGTTQYFYKAWSFDGADYSLGLTANATTLKGEPTNTVTNLDVASGVSSIIVRWDEPTTGVLPDGILVKVSNSGLGSITDPEDGTAESNDLDLTDGTAIANVAYGTEFISFTGLTQGASYSVKVYPYSNSASTIDFKLTDVQSDQGSVASYLRQFRETFPTASTTLFNVYSSTDNATYDFDGDGDVRTSSASTGYSNASGGGNAFFTTTPKNLVISGINTTGLSNFSLLFGMNSSSNVGLIVEVSSDGVSYDTLQYNLPTTSGWRLITIAGAQIPATANLRIRFTNNSSSIRLDDLELYAEGAQTTLSTTAGWRMMSSPVSTTYATLLGPVWTQGATGSDSPSNGAPNVFTHVSGDSSYTAVSDLGATIPAGQGFIYYHFGKDNYTTPNAAPTTLTVTGTEHAANTALSPTHGSGVEYAIAGNPFASTIQFDNVTRGGNGQNKMWVWNPATTTYLTRSSGSGTSTGLIAPFQGFWVEYNGSGSSFTFGSGAKSTGATFLGKETVTPELTLKLSDGDRSNLVWFGLRENASVGMDELDAAKFIPLANDYLMGYSVAGDKNLDLNFLPASATEAIRIPLGYETTRGGELEWTLDANSFPTDWMVSIHDAETGTTHPVNADFSLRFAGTRSKAAPVNPLEISRNPVFKTAATAPRFTLIIDPASSTSTKDDGRGTMDEFALDQNYPNPFNPSTQIRFALRASGLARLTVYDVLGREVAVLVNGTLAAGAHSVTFDASNLTSGVYMYKLEAGGMTQTKRMTLVK